MNSEDGSADRDRHLKEPFDPIDYHRRLVAAILDKGVENASPLQIFDRMTLPQDPTNYTFRDLQLGQIKSHLQRFRKVYKSDNLANCRSSQSSANTLGGNAEKENFLDDYDNFVDFGLDAAAARSDEQYSSILGGRIIGLVSRMIMMNDGVKIQDFSKHHSLQEKNQNTDQNFIQKQNLDKTIPKLSVLEHATPLGQSIKLVVGLLHYLNDYIESERHRVVIPTTTYPTAIGQDLSYKNASRLPPIAGQVQKQHPLIHPSIAGQILRQQQQQVQTSRNLGTVSTISKDPQQMQVQPMPQQRQQQQQHRERADSLSDVSSIGDARALMTDEGLHFAMLIPKSNNPDDPNPNTQRLGKFIPVTAPRKMERNSSVPVHVQGRVYHPRAVPPSQQQPIPPASIQQQRIGSFDIPQQVSVKANHDTHKDVFTQHALAALAASAVAAVQLHPTTIQVQPQNSATNPTNRQLPPRPPRRTVSEFPFQKACKTEIDKVETTTLQASNQKEHAPNIAQVSHGDRSQKSRFPTKPTSPSHTGYLETLNRNRTVKTRLENDDDASVASSLSSSSSSSLESDFNMTNAMTNKPRKVAGLLAMQTQQNPPVEGGLVSPANTGSETNSYHEEDKNWMFHHNPIPRNLKLKIFQENGMEDDEEDDDDDDGHNSWCSKNSTSTEQTGESSRGVKKYEFFSTILREMMVSHHQSYFEERLI